MQNTQITTEDRIDEAACLLATAIKRLTIRETSINRETIKVDDWQARSAQTEAYAFPQARCEASPAANILLDFNAYPSVHADAEKNSYGGIK